MECYVPVTRLAALVCSLALTAAASGQQLSKGHRILLEKALQLQATTLLDFNENWFSKRDFSLSRFKGVRMGLISNYNPSLYGPLGDTDVGVVLIHRSTPAGPALALGDNLVSLQYLDEQDLYDPGVLADTKRWFDTVRQDPAYNNVILHTNQFGMQINTATMRHYMAQCKPDMLMLDWYSFGIPDPAHYGNGSRAARGLGP